MHELRFLLLSKTYHRNTMTKYPNAKYKIHTKQKVINTNIIRNDYKPSPSQGGLALWASAKNLY